MNGRWVEHVCHTRREWIPIFGNREKSAVMDKQKASDEIVWEGMVRMNDVRGPTFPAALL
jgi:hypothetical protein